MNKEERKQIWVLGCGDDPSVVSADNCHQSNGPWQIHVMVLLQSLKQWSVDDVITCYYFAYHQHINRVIIGAVLHYYHHHMLYHIDKEELQIQTNFIIHM